MTLPVCAVQCYVYTQDGNPEPGATVTAKLTHYEVYNGHIVPEEMTATTDEDGLAVLELWPNELGSTGSSYKVKIQPVGKRLLTVYAVVPLEAEANLSEIATLPVYEGKPDGQIGVELANAALVAANNAVIASAASATTASEQAGIATAQAGAAAGLASNASTSAGIATTQAGIATTQAGTATAQAGIATAQAVIATNKAAEAAASALATASLSSAYRNKVINGNFRVNIRAVSGTVVLTAGAYGHDRWKAGASGCTYTFATSENVTTITISAGSLIQVVDGVNLQTGTHYLGWNGTAQGRIAGGSYGASGQTYAVTGGTNVNIEFNTGTISLVQFEPGTVRTSFEHRMNESAICSFYASPMPGFSAGQAYGTTGALISVVTPVPMRATPTLVGGTFQLLNATGTPINCASTPVTSKQGCVVRLDPTVASGLVAGNATTLASPGGSYLSAEL